MLKAIHIQQSIQWVGQWYTLQSFRRKAMPHTIMFHYVYHYSSQEEACSPYHCLFFWYLCNRICFINRKSRNSSQKLSRVTAPKTCICLSNGTIKNCLCTFMFDVYRLIYGNWRSGGRSWRRNWRNPTLCNVQRAKVPFQWLHQKWKDGGFLRGRLCFKVRMLRTTWNGWAFDYHLPKGWVLEQLTTDL